MSPDIPNIEIPAWPQASKRDAELMQEVLDSPQWGGFHPFVSEFEARFATFQNTSYAAAACNGTVTLELALEVLKIGTGDEVIVPAISFIASATAISRRGALPVFVDIEEGSFNIDPKQILLAITVRTKAVLAVHFGGIPCNLDAISAICRDHNLILIEDAAHAQGSEWLGQRLGSFGVAGSFSFQNGKVLCSGEGGALVSSDAAFIEEARSLINCGRRKGDSFYVHHGLGSNLRMTGFQAAVLLAQLERLPRQNTKRTQNVALLRSLLADEDYLEWQAEPPEMTACSWYLLVAKCPNNNRLRNKLVIGLNEAGVPCSSFYPHTLYQNPVYQSVPYRALPCPVAEQRVQDAFWFPHRLLLAEEQTISEVAALIREGLRAGRPS